MKLFACVFFVIQTLYCQPLKSVMNSYQRADSIAKSLQGESLKNLPVLVHRLTSNLENESQKFRAIFKWVCHNIANDYTSYRKTIQRRKKFKDQPEKLQQWNTSYLPKVYERLVTQRKTSCTGYAYLLKQMAVLAGLKCEIIDGYSKTPSRSVIDKTEPNHSWNAIKLDNKWFLCDPTWAAGKIILENDEPIFKFIFSEAYFLTPPELFSKTHYPLNTEWQLTKEIVTFNEFKQAPLVYTSAINHQFNPIAPKTMFITTQKEELIEFQFTLKKAESKLSMIIIGRGHRKEIIPKRHLDASIQKIKYRFAKRGIYDVHLAVNDKICATYVVKVNKDPFYP